MASSSSCKGKVRKSPLDSYLDSLVSDPAERAKRRQFYQDLHLFYKRKWNSRVKNPIVNEIPLDLFQLYHAVISFGGWQKVTSSNRWPDVLEKLEIPGDIMVAEHAIKVIYMKHLYRFELSYQYGEEDDNRDDVGGRGGSSRGKSYMTSMVNFVDNPYGRNRRHHTLGDGARASLKLAKAGSRYTPYDRLLKALESGLPNEVDFAVNICTLLSHPGPKFLRLPSAPSILSLLLAHAGIFIDGPGSYRQLYEENWRKSSGRKFVDFWRAGITDPQLRELLGPPDSEINEKFTDLDRGIFADLGPSFDSKDPVTHRIMQISSIIRNLSFESVNKPTLASSRALTKFLNVCINSTYTPLQSMALDTLSNIACEISLEGRERVRDMETLFRSLSKCLHSEDKFQIIRSMETLAGLCAKEKNESVLTDFLDNETLQKILTLVIVKDIMMCVYTLECLYQISELGSVTCQRISEQPHAIDVLVDLATVEAVSFGPSGLMGMKVVEYGLPQPHTAILPHPTPQPQPPRSQPLPPARQHHSLPQHPPHLNPNNTIHHRALPQQRNPSLPNGPPGAMMGSPRFVSGPPPPQPQRPPVPRTASPAAPTAPFRGPGSITVHQDQQAEHLTLNWLRQNCQVDASANVSRGELYASYVTEMHKVFGSLAVSANTFSTLLRQAFPTCVVRKADPSRPTLMQIEGIRFLPRSSTAFRKQQQHHYSVTGSGSSSPALNSNSGNVSHSAPGAPPPNPNTNPTTQPPTQTTSGALASQHPLVHSMLSRNSPVDSKFRSPLNPPAQTLPPACVTNPPPTPTAPTPSDPGDEETTKSHLEGKNPSVVNSVNPPPSTALPTTSTALIPNIRRRSTSTSLGSKGGLEGGLENPEESMSGTETPDSLLSGSDPSCSSPSPSPNPTHLSPNQKSSGIDKSGKAKLPLPKIPPNCHLEVCEPAKEAKNLIEITDTHEAKILRVENTAASTESMKSANVAPTTEEQKATTTEQLPVFNAAPSMNGEVTHDSDETSLDGEKSAKVAEVKVNGENVGEEEEKMDTEEESDSNKANKIANFEDTIDAVVAVLKQTEQKRPNGLVTDVPKPSGTANGRHYTPSPDSMKQNLCHAQDSINQLLGEDMLPNPVARTGSAASSLADMPSPGLTPSGKKSKRKPGMSQPRNSKKKLSISSSTSSVDVKPFKRGSTDFTGGPEAKRMCPANQANASTSAQPPPPPAPVQRIAIPVPTNLQYMCEWNGCGRLFTKASAVFYHASTVHINDETDHCRWPNCDQTPRVRWSLITHLQDLHCSEMALKTAALRRYEISVMGNSYIPEPRPPPQHPGYSKNAALEAIRRHAFNYIQKELGVNSDETEGPVTKSIRLTSCLILRNLARYSTDGRRKIKRHERDLTSLAFSRLESSTTLAQCLAELISPPSSPSST